MDHLLLVDGSNLLFQMFYGMPNPILSRDGQPIQGTVGFVGGLLRILRLVKPTHAAVFFDGECSNPRTELDSGYKSDRPDYSLLPPEEVPFSQLPHIRAALELLGIAHAETTCCETDDWLAAYALNLESSARLTLSSFDSDLFQLIRDNVTVLRYRGEKTQLCDREYIRQKLGITPEQYPAFKALTGDSADHIPGVPGIGPKRAAWLMNRFATPEALLAQTEEIPWPSVRASVEASRERIDLNLRLIRLTGCAPLPLKWEDMIWHDMELTTGKVLAGIGLK